MSVSGTINDNAGLNARIGSVSQVSGSVSQGNELVVTRIAVFPKFTNPTRCCWFFRK